MILPTDELETVTAAGARDPHFASLLERLWFPHAYLFMELLKQGIDVIGESQLVGYPSQFPSCFHDGLDKRKTERPILGMEADQG